MKTADKMTMQLLASCYEHILEVGEDAILEEIRKLGDDTLSVYPHVLEKIKNVDANLVWHECRMDETEMHLEGEKLPIDGAYSYWKFKDGPVYVGRFKYDAIDHFYPRIGKDERDIIAWAKI